MPGASRLGDKSFCPADGHGCPGCSHPVQGPAVAGSPNVLINNKPALRVGDSGIHSACCGPNTWTATKGSATVIINGMPAMRLGDMCTHCGGVGKMIEASTNVFIGDNPGTLRIDSIAPAEHSKDNYNQAFQLVDQLTGEPLENMPYRIISNSETIEGYTDENGYTKIIHTGDRAENVSFELIEDDIDIFNNEEFLDWIDADTVDWN